MFCQVIHLRSRDIFDYLRKSAKHYRLQSRDPFAGGADQTDRGLRCLKRVQVTGLSQELFGVGLRRS